MADKYLAKNATNPDTIKEVEVITTSSGAADAGKMAGVGANGRWDETFMPTGIGADVATVEASEDLSAGDFVNLHISTGAKVRKADATTAGKEADGFVKASVTAGNNATVYLSGINDQLTSLTPMDKYFLGTTAGAAVAVGSIPSASGNVQQYLGKALSATEIFFSKQPGVELA